MSERNPSSKRDAREFEASSTSTSVSPLKKKKLDDSSTDSPDVVILAVPSSSVASAADLAPGGFSVPSAGEDDDQSSSICCLSSESNEIARNSPTSVVDLETREISEVSTSITSNFRKEENPAFLGETTTTEMESPSATERDDRKKPREVDTSPTPAEVEKFLSELENDDEKKRFIEKYNFDIVNDKPLEGRYKWDRLN
ncbi:unnamed protein product [Thlaspi arvense]|uniref:Cyclin-dependent kinase inhibitor domain-containing protein n=1 Tax=Thlaspi arvense TaxID=13288 RepID=A0AAU9RY43_THLAR|nr:unnamed protein product [Thlaspi arvense]